MARLTRYLYEVRPGTAEAVVSSSAGRAGVESWTEGPPGTLLVVGDERWDAALPGSEQGAILVSSTVIERTAEGVPLTRAVSPWVVSSGDAATDARISAARGGR